MRFRHKREINVGTRPGALGDAPDRISSIRVVDFDTENIIDQEFQSLDETFDFAKSKRNTWLHITGEPGADTLRNLREAFNLHPLAVEDVLNVGQRPKTEQFDEQLFIINVVADRTESNIEFEQLSLFVGDSYVISFHDGDADIFAPVRARIHEGKGKIRSAGPDYLAYCLIDVVVDLGFPILESYADELEHLEQEIFADPRSNPIEAIHRIRSDLTTFRRMAWHQNLMLKSLLEEGGTLLDPDNTPYFRDAEDHSQRVMDLLETYYDMASNLLDTHLSLVSNRMNDVMKMLTLIATIFIPLSFLVGVYGMNFDTESPWNLPELSYRFGYPILMGFMVVIVAGMLAYFRKRGWI